MQPLPLFDGIDHHVTPNSSAEAYAQKLTEGGLAVNEFKALFDFLMAYQGSKDTFNTYRREIERFYHWCWLIEGSGLFAATRLSIQSYLKFVVAPPKSWQAKSLLPRYIDELGVRKPNPQWRPFIAQKKLSDKSLQSLVASLSTMYAYLVQEGLVARNPVLMLRQKKQYIQNEVSKRITRKLSQRQWRMVIEQVQHACVHDSKYERHLFLLSMFFLLGLRISEVAHTEKRMPKMTDFIQDAHQCYWFATVGKGNKYREIAVCDAMLDMLVRYRRWLKLTDYPMPAEQTPLCPKQKGQGGIGVRQVRYLIQESFQMAIDQLHQEGDHDEAQSLQNATVHWLRHTSISADVQYRPREHVRDDAGHDNVTITDRYIDVDLQERHRSARTKQLLEE
jgi:site-specific recombinase XerD